MMIAFAFIFLLTFLAMELFSYLIHRFVYHGIAWFVHKSHHAPRKGTYEWDDIFPLLFASVTAPLVIYAVDSSRSPALTAVALGITAYGLIYFIVHDLYVHRRVKRFRLRIPFLRKLKQAHALHHRYGGEPYGLLFFADPAKMAMEHLDEADPV